MKATLILLITLSLLSCAQKESIKVGYISNLTGRQSELGIRGRDGISMAIRERNSIGGIDGREIELIIKDHKGDKDLCLIRTIELISEGVEVIISPLTSSMASSVIKGTKGSNVLIISPTVSTDSLTSIDDNFLRLTPASSQQGRALGEIIENRGETKITVVYDDTNKEYASGVISGLDDVTTGEINSLSFNDKSQIPDIVEELKNKTIDSLLFISTGIDASQIIQNLAKSIDLPSLYGSSWVKVSNIVQHGGKVINGMLVTDNYISTVKTTREIEFINKFNVLYNIDPNLPAIYSYEATQLFIDIKSSNPKEVGIELKENILSLGEIMGVSDSYKFDKYGDVIREQSLFMIDNGEYLIYE